jgi:hypothetical protein
MTLFLRKTVRTDTIILSASNLPLTVHDYFLDPENMEELLDILEFCAFIELMVVVQPDFNSNPLVDLSDSQTPVTTHVQYLHLAVTRARMRDLLCLLDSYFSIQPIPPDSAPSQTITEGFQHVLSGTANEIFHLLGLFQPQSEAETDSESEDVPFRPHYNDSGMQRCFMLDNLNRVMDFWGLKRHVERRGVWGSAVFSSKKFQVVRKPGVRVRVTQPGVYFLLPFSGSLIYIFTARDPRFSHGWHDSEEEYVYRHCLSSVEGNPTVVQA